MIDMEDMVLNYTVNIVRRLNMEQSRKFFN